MYSPTSFFRVPLALTLLSTVLCHPINGGTNRIARHRRNIPNSVRDMVYGPPWSKDNEYDPEGKCGPLNGNKSCPGDQCCSKFGYCGSGLYYCGHSARQYSVVNVTERGDTGKIDVVSGKCGKQNDGKMCAIDYCCSEWGYCGVGEGFCNAKSQVDFHGGASAGGSSSGGSDPAKDSKGKVDNTTGLCGESNAGQMCAKGYCCSEWGYCGTDGTFCNDKQQYKYAGGS